MKLIDEGYINKAALELSNKTNTKGMYEAGIYSGFKSGFKSGVLFAQRWIPIEEGLPEKTNHGFSELVLTKNSFGNIMLERYDFKSNTFNSVRYDSGKKGDGQVSHWRPIFLA